MVLGINRDGEAVGVATIGTVVHGYTWNRERSFNVVDDPNGVGTTTINASTIAASWSGA
jgi:hypothetical protein